MLRPFLMIKTRLKEMGSPPPPPPPVRTLGTPREDHGDLI